MLLSVWDIPRGTHSINFLVLRECCWGGCRRTAGLPQHRAFSERAFEVDRQHDQSNIRKTDGLEYGGYEFRGFGGQFRVGQKKLVVFEQPAAEVLRRKRGVSMRTRLNEFRSYARGWLAYFRLAQVKSTFRDLDKWLRRRVRACYLKQWPKSKIRLKRLIPLGVPKRDALGAARSGKGPWRLSMTLPVQRGLSIEFLAEQGLFNLEEYWLSLHQ